MCGRFTRKENFQRMAEQLGLKGLPPLSPGYMRRKGVTHLEGSGQVGTPLLFLCVLPFWRWPALSKQRVTSWFSLDYGVDSES
jgi:hypothetical protein